MNLLAFDTSGEILSVGFFRNGKQVSNYQSDTLSRHSEYLAPGIATVLKKANVVMDSLDCIAVGLGPGSFTGLRIGVTTAKLLTYQSKCKLVGVPSIEAEALRAGKGVIAVMKDAKKSMVYAAIYENEKKFKILMKPSLLPVDLFIKKLKKKTRVSGSAVSLYGNQLEKIGAEILPPLGDPEASDIASRALDAVQRRAFADAYQLTPLYLHRRDCNATKPKKVRR